MEVEAKVILTGRYAEFFLSMMDSFGVDQDQLATDLVLHFLNTAIGELMTDKLRQELQEERKKQLIKLTSSSRKPRTQPPERKKIMTFREFVNQRKAEQAQ